MRPGFQQLLHIADAACLIDIQGHIAGLNSAAISLFGDDGGAATGRHHHDVAPFNQTLSEHCGVCQALWQASRGGRLDRWDVLQPTDNGDRWLRLTALPLHDQSTLLGLAILIQDISRERTNEVALRALLQLYARLGGPTGLDSNASSGPALEFDPRLTRRERQVLIYLTAGMGVRDIAGRMSLSYNTARNHVQNVLHKLNVHNKAQAVAVALRHGLVDPREHL